MKALELSQFIHQHFYGVLSTHSVSEPGYPFGSMTPYIVTDNGDLAIYISHLAEHSHNIAANPKVSLTISDIEDPTSPHSGSRITCLADASIAQDQALLRKTYLDKFPDAEMILDLPGFKFHILKIYKIRLVAGFGKASWLTTEQFSLRIAT